MLFFYLCLANVIMSPVDVGDSADTTNSTPASSSTADRLLESLLKASTRRIAEVVGGVTGGLIVFLSLAVGLYKWCGCPTDNKWCIKIGLLLKCCKCVQNKKNRNEEI